ncbi:nucleotidyltransferase domain-containing protein [Paenibacillus mendelii]|uniref:Nucleotidyltransferase domain-containing protein n=1 Tax=Paenibacillus mendelii TaxID=206163 RepID=A0ABV6JIE6_9BACL
MERLARGIELEIGILPFDNGVSRAFTFLNNRGFDWSICGGVAIDIFLGKQNRIHKDHYFLHNK